VTFQATILPRWLPKEKGGAANEEQVRERTAGEMTDLIGMTKVNANDDSFAPMALAA
jgi:hypothetical protein